MKIACRLLALVMVLTAFSFDNMRGGDAKEQDIQSSGLNTENANDVAPVDNSTAPDSPEFRPFLKDIAPVSDIWPEMCDGPHTPSVIAAKVRLLASLGFKRIYFVVPPPGYAAFSMPDLDLFGIHNNIGHHGLESLIMTGDPCTHIIRTAHEAGMEAFAVFKVYEGGSGHTLPHGWLHPVRKRFLTQIGGDAHAFDPFILEHPAMRVRRKQIPDYDELLSQTLTKLEISFLLDGAKQETWNDRFIEYPAQPNFVIQEKPVRDFRIWTSEDNGEYVHVKNGFEISERLQARTVTGANGENLCNGKKRFRVITVTGLNIPEYIPYLAVTFRNDDNSLVTIPQSMIKAWGQRGEIPLTCTERVRYIATPGLVNDEKGGEKTFRDIGFEFDWHGLGFFGPGWKTSTVYGIARGKNEYMKGTLCEAYPEVREHWLYQVNRLLEMGADGIDFRLQNHSAMVSDYMAYGYNEPIVEEYRRRHGIDILTEEAEPLEIMRIRGDFFMMFVEEAARAIKSNGAILQFHFRNALEKPRLSYRFVELGGWPLPKILPGWRRMLELADEVSIKDMNMGTYHPGLSEQIKNTAYGMGKPVWIHCYLSQGSDLNPEFCEAVERDKRVTGMLLYEVNHGKNKDNPRGGGMIGVDDNGRLFTNRPMIDAVKSLLDVH